MDSATAHFNLVCLCSAVEGEDEGGAGGDVGVEGEVSVDLFGAEGADREAETCAFADVGRDGEGFEDVFAFVFGDAGACVGHDELMAFGPALTVGEGDLSSFRSVFGRVFEQMGEDLVHFRGVDSRIAFASVEIEGDARIEHRAYSGGDGVAVGLEVHFFEGFFLRRR